MFAVHAIAPKQPQKKRFILILLCQWCNRFQRTALRTVHKKKLQTWQSFLKRYVQEVCEKAYGDEVGRARNVELHLNWSVHCALTQL